MSGVLLFISGFLFVVAFAESIQQARGAAQNTTVGEVAVMFVASGLFAIAGVLT